MANSLNTFMENRIIYKILLDSDLGSSLPLSQADFGLWFNHKGRHYFSGIAEVGHISRLIQDLTVFSIKPCVTPEI